MSRYNQKVKRTVETVTNHQGGTGVKYDPKLELIAILTTGLDNSYYEKLSDRENRFIQLIDELSKKDIEFVAKALVYARTVVGQRSVTHFGSVSLVKHLSGSSIGKRFFSKRDKNAKTGGIVYRLDDVLEIIAAYQHFNPGKPLPNSMKKGFKAALESADTYELAKYQGKGKSVSLVDVVNLVRPKPTTPQMEGVFKDLMSGKLKQFNTVEDKNSKSGQDVAAKVKSGEITKAQAEVELTQAKESNYAELIKTRKIGYLALLRNLRNIINTSSNSELVSGACELLIDEKLIRKSLVFPHQIDIALEILLQETSASASRPFVTALNKAYELAIPNLVELFSHGRTAVVIDTSGSMHGMGHGVTMNGKAINKHCIDKAALIGATLAKGIGADLYQFATTTEGIRYNPGDSINTIKNTCLSLQGRVGHGTDFGSIFSTLQASGKYDRIFIISDLQGGDRIVTNSSFQSYKSKHGEPFIYTVDIQGYGTTMFKPGNKLVQLFGYSADIYEMIKKAEVDPKAILREIEAIVI